jgi:predicted transcriptional regulator
VKQGEQMMKTVTLDVRSPEEAAQDFVNAWKTGKAQKSARISFATPELLWKVLTAKRWDILKAMRGAGPVTVREIARRVERDVKSVQTDLTALVKAGVLDKTEGGQVVLPCESVKVEFLLQAA